MAGKAADAAGAAVDAAGTEAGEDAFLRTVSGPGAGGIVPQLVRKHTGFETVSFLFRPRFRSRDAYVVAKAGDEVLYRRKYPAVTPGEMCRVDLPGSKLPESGTIEFSIEGVPV